MNINKFKQGDIVTRTKRAKTHYSKDVGDGSYVNDKLEFVGIEKSMIVLIHLESHFENEIITLTNDEAWSEGWDYYPQSIIDKATKRIKELVEPTKLKERS